MPPTTRSKLRTVLQNLGLVALSCVFALLLVEFGLRLFVQPSDRAFGELFGHQLPPLRIAAVSPPVDRTEPYESLIVEGDHITRGDLWGYQRPDPVLGYTTQENVVSVNGWWQSNNLGARSRQATTYTIPPGKTRVITFGDSFTQGSRVPQDQTWTYHLDKAYPDMEVINFGVDGYSMAQAFLRFQIIEKIVEYDTVVMMFVPKSDTWRDINTVRNLAFGWKMPYVLPRYVLEDGELRLVQSPYADHDDVYQDNKEGISEKLKNFLRRYDRFYVDIEYESPTILQYSMIYKLIVSAIAEDARRDVLTHRVRSDSEAIAVSRAIFERMADMVRSTGKQFLLVVLPAPQEVQRLRSDPAYFALWSEMLRTVCGPTIPCLELRSVLLDAPAAQIDLGYDGTHYGPKANRLIAREIARRLADVTVVQNENGVTLPDRPITIAKHR